MKKIQKKTGNKVDKVDKVYKKDKKEENLSKLSNKSKCSRKDKRASNYQYVCDPFTGNWVNIDGKIGSKLAKRFGRENLINFSRKIPSDFEYMLTTNQPALEILIQESGMTYEDLQKLRATSRWLKHALDRPYYKKLIEEQLITKIDEWPDTMYRGHNLAKTIYHKNKNKILRYLNDEVLARHNDHAFIEDEVMIGYSPSADEFYSVWEVDIPTEWPSDAESVTYVIAIKINNEGELKILEHTYYGRDFEQSFQSLKEDIDDLIVIHLT